MTVKWTKKEQRAVQIQRDGLKYTFTDAGIEHYGEQRLVEREIRNLAELRKEWAKQADETAAHYLAHFKNREIHDTFRDNAAKYRKEGAWYAKLADKVRDNGMPNSEDS